MRLIREIFWLLIGAVVFLDVMHFASKGISPLLHNRFNLDLEATVPAWFSSIMLFCVSLVALAIYLFDRDTAKRKTIRWSWFWLVFSIAYCFLSVDEGARLHEMLEERGIRWLVVYGPFALIFFLMCIYYVTLVRKDPRLKTWVLGGLAVSALGGIVAESTLHVFRFVRLYEAEVLIEESFEMLGTIMVLRGCLQEAARCRQLKWG